VVDKQPGILSAPSLQHTKGELPERGHLPELLRRVYRRRGIDLDFLGQVHRLDRETSGCICFARTREAQRMLSSQFAGSAAGRTYRALVMGNPRRDQDSLRGKLGRGVDGRRAVVDDDEDGKESVTNFRVMRRFPRGSELEVSLETGRTHQIRVMLKDIGCPVYGDKVYTFEVRKGEIPPLRAPRLMLHASELSFDHPKTGKRISVQAPIPATFTSFAERLAVDVTVDEPWKRRKPRPDQDDAGDGDSDEPRSVPRAQSRGDQPRAQPRTTRSAPPRGARRTRG
jgi:23S rRNA pseudouridine1911/1915/1917 synthase